MNFIISLIRKIRPPLPTITEIARAHGYYAQIDLMNAESELERWSAEVKALRDRVLRLSERESDDTHRHTVVILDPSNGLGSTRSLRRNVRNEGDLPLPARRARKSKPATSAGDSDGRGKRATGSASEARPVDSGRPPRGEHPDRVEDPS